MSTLYYEVFFAFLQGLKLQLGVGYTHLSSFNEFPKRNSIEFEPLFMYSVSTIFS